MFLGDRRPVISWIQIMYWGWFKKINKIKHNGLRELLSVEHFGVYSQFERVPTIQGTWGTTTMARAIQWSPTGFAWPTTSCSTTGCTGRWRSMWVGSTSSPDPNTCSRCWGMFLACINILEVIYILTISEQRCAFSIAFDSSPDKHTTQLMGHI